MRDKLNSDRCAEYLKALADTDRLRIVQCLQKGPRPVGEICRELNAAIANISHHLKQLRQAGLVQSHKAGRQMIYSLSPDIAGKAMNPMGLNVLEFGCCRIELGR